MFVWWSFISKKNLMFFDINSVLVSLAVASNVVRIYEVCYA